VGVALQGFQIVPEREVQRKYLSILMVACLALLLTQGWILLFFGTLGRQLRGLGGEEGAAIVERVQALGRRCRPWTVAALLLAMAFFLLNPAFGHRWAPGWLAPGLLLLAFGAHIAAVGIANGALREQEILLKRLDGVLHRDSTATS
jgi:hypothetical protein